MRFVVLIFVLAGFNCSSSNKESAKEPPASGPGSTTSKESLAVKPPVSPPALKPNMTMFGAEITSIQFTDDVNYVMEISLRTALPHGSAESFAEPGQNLVVRPAYELDAQGRLDSASQRNKRLLECRTLKAGDPIIGKISLFQDGQWYLVDTTLD